MKATLLKFSAVLIYLGASITAHAQDKVYIRLTTYDGQVVPAANAPGNKPGWLEAKTFSFDTEQTLSIGSQSTGAGAGKISFNPMKFSLAPSTVDPKLFQAAATGTAYKTMEIEVAHASGGTVEQFTCKLVAVKSIGWALDKTQTLETQVSLEYGALIVTIPKQNPGDILTTAGWDRVKNIAVTTP